MYNRFYIKSVILILKEKSEVDRFLPLLEKLKQEEISVQMSEAGVEGSFICTDAALYITDCCKTASTLQSRNLPVLGWLREGESLGDIDYVMECPEDLDVRYLDRIYRRYQNIPWDILETERCVIRETEVSDVDGFFEIYSNPEIVRYTEPLYSDRQQEISYIKEYIEKVYRYFEFGIWTVLWKETGEIIGRAGLDVREGYELPELGFVIGKSWQGKGVAYEICSAILQYGKEEYEFDRVQALVVPENEVSLSLCRKLGFEEQEKVLEKGAEYILLIKEL